MATVVVWMTIGTTSRLGHVRYDLHASRNDTSGSATSAGISGRSWTAKSLGELFIQSATDIVRGDVDSIGNSEDDKRSFCRQR